MTRGRRRGPPFGYTLVVTAVAAVVLSPILWAIVRGLGAGDVWGDLWWNGQLRTIFITTIALAAIVSSVSSFLGAILAWITTRTDVFGRRALAIVGVAPLGIPPFLVAAVLLALLGPGGAIPRMTGWPRVPIFGLTGSSLVLTVVCTPYSLLFTRAALLRSDPALEDAAASLGAGRIRTLFQVTLPLIRPAAIAGALISALYCLVDFGVVSLLRTNTFSAAIYTQLTTRFSRAGASALSLVLVLVGLGVLLIHGWVLKKAPPPSTSPTCGTAPPIRLGRYRWPVTLIAWAYALAVIVIPVATLFGWAVRATGDGLRINYLTETLRTVIPSAAAAVIAVVTAVPIARMVTRYPGWISSAISRSSQLSDAMPGVVIGLALTSITNLWLPTIYSTVTVVVIAYVILFMTRAIQGSIAAFVPVSRDIEDAAQALAHRNVTVWTRVIAPVIRPGIAATWLVVFLSAARELPATLLLRPPGFNTLATAIWNQTSEGYYELASIPAVILVAISLVTAMVIIRRSDDTARATR